MVLARVVGLLWPLYTLTVELTYTYIMFEGSLVIKEFISVQFCVLTEAPMMTYPNTLLYSYYQHLHLHLNISIVII